MLALQQTDLQQSQMFRCSSSVFSTEPASDVIPFEESERMYWQFRWTIEHCDRSCHMWWLNFDFIHPILSLVDFAVNTVFKCKCYHHGYLLQHINPRDLFRMLIYAFTRAFKREYPREISYCYLTHALWDLILKSSKRECELHLTMKSLKGNFRIKCFRTLRSLLTTP